MRSVENLMQDFGDLFIDLFRDMGNLLLDELSETFRIPFIETYSTEPGFYFKLPSRNFEFDEPLVLSGFGGVEESYDPYNILTDDDVVEERDEEEQSLIQTPSAPYYGNIVIKKVPRYILGYHVLGRAFPYLGLVEIASDLYGFEFEEVKTHEILHIKNPQASEMEIRRLTKEILTFTPRFH